MKKYKISVIVALYNTIDYLPAFFNCLKKQIFKDFEVIIIDDLSTDGSYEYAEQFILNNPDMAITLIKGEEKLLPDRARQLGYRKVNGEYVIYLDSDDEFSDDYLYEMISLADENNLDFAVSSCQRIDNTGKKYGKKRLLSKNTIPLMTSKQKECLIRGRYGGWNRMAKKTFLDSFGYDFLSAELPLYILQFDENARVGYTTKGCYFYRARGGSISRSKVPQRISNYDLLEPIDWYKRIQINKNKYPLGIYLYRMLLPYIYFKKAFVKEYNFKKDIKFVKQECNYSFLKALKYWWFMQKRDKFMLAVFVLRMHWVVFYFIKKYRS